MYINSFNFKDSADTFIQGNLYCIQGISLHVGYSLGIKPELGIASVMLHSSNSAIFCQKLDRWTLYSPRSQYPLMYKEPLCLHR